MDYGFFVLICLLALFIGDILFVTILLAVLEREQSLIRRVADLDQAIAWHKQEHTFARQTTAGLLAEEYPAYDTRVEFPVLPNGLRRTRLLRDNEERV